MIIGICGLIGSGKDTVAGHLISNHNFEKRSFADKLKDAVSAMFDWDREMLEGKSKDSREWREQPDVFWSKETDQSITPRLVLQKFGTECMRQGFFDGIWVSLVKKKILDNPDTNWIIHDVRFPNEVKMLKEVGGSVWRVKRGDDPIWFSHFKYHGVQPQNIHPSEYAWANTDFDYMLENNSSIEQLNVGVDNIISDLQKDRLVSNRAF